MWIIYIFLACLSAALAGVSLRFVTNNRYLTIFTMAITAFLSVAITKEYLMPQYLAYTFAQSIRKASPLVDLIAKNSPEEFNRYVDSVRRNIINNDSNNDIYLNTNSLISAVLIKNIPYATNESIYRYLTDCLALDKELMQVDPRYVLFVEYPGRFTKEINSVNVLEHVKPETIAELLAAKQAIIISALENRQPDLNISQRLRANFIYTDILSNISAQYGRQMMLDAFQRPDALNTDQQKAAEVIIQYYEAILAKGPDGAGMIYKSLFSVK